MASAGDLKQRSEKLLAELTKQHAVGGDPKATLGWEFLELAAGSYEGEHIRFDLNEIAASGSDKVFGRASSGRLEVSFRGTLGLQNLDQWIFGKGNTTAALVKPEDSPLQGAVHSGFWSGYGGLREQFLDRVEKQMEKHAVQVVRVTGHSRGAAFATLAAPDLAHRFPDSQVELVLWAPPRVGDSTFGTFCGQLANLSIVAFANKADPVAHLPPDSLPSAVLKLLPEGAADSLQGFAHVVEPLILDAAFTGAVGEGLGFVAGNRTPHDIEQYQENYELFFEDVLVACREKKVQLCRDGFQVALGLVLRQGQATSREVQACASELRRQGEATQKLLQDAGKHIAESLSGLETRIVNEIREARLKEKASELRGAVNALECALRNVSAAGRDAENRLRPAIEQAKLQVFGAAELAKALEDDDGFEALFELLVSALCVIIYAAMAFPLDAPAYRGFFAEAQCIHEKLSPLIGRRVERAESSADLWERVPEFEKLARAWKLIGQHEDCPPTFCSLLPDESARLLQERDRKLQLKQQQNELRAAMTGWGFRAKEQQARAEELLGRLEEARTVEAFKEATHYWNEHWERMSGARKLLEDAKPVLAVGGRANAGKTTFLNAVLHRWVEGAPTDLLPVSAEENTSCITELHLEVGDGPRGALAELSRKVLDSDTFVEDPGFPKVSFSEWKSLQKALGESVQDHFYQERRQERRLTVTLFNAKRALLLCDTPGMDGRNNIAALKKFARDSVFMYIHLAAVSEGSLGNQPFELFSQLHKQSSLPPIVVFTKYEDLTALKAFLFQKEAKLPKDARNEEGEDDPRKKAELAAEKSIEHNMGVLLEQLPGDAGHRCLPLFAGVSEDPRFPAGAQQLDEVLDFIGVALQEYTELRRADAFVSFVARETDSLINALLQSEPGVFSETDLLSYRHDLVGKMEYMVEEYFRGFPQNKMELYAYPTEDKKQKVWSKATHHLLQDLEAVHQATHKTWSRETYIEDVMRKLSKRWQEAYYEDISAESYEVLSSFASAIAKDMSHRAGQQMMRGTLLADVGLQLLLAGGASSGLFAVAVGIVTVAENTANVLAFISLMGVAATAFICVGLVATNVAVVAYDQAGAYDSKAQAGIALDQVVGVLHSKIDEIKRETKTCLGTLARQVVERMAAFRDPSMSELGQAGNLDGCRDNVGEAVKASHELRMEMQAALQRMHRWVGGDARLEQIVLRSLESDGGRELKTAKGGA